MIICIDIDNCLNNLTEKVLALYNSQTGKNIQISDVTTYNFYDCLPQEDAKGITELFVSKELWDTLTPLPGSQNTLKQLINNGHQIYLATATDFINFEWKCNWINQFYPFIPTDNIIRIMNKSLLNVDVLIDDCLDNLITSYAYRVCMDYPWNKSTSKDYAYNIRRAYSWNGIVNIIKTIEKEMREWEK
jgi:5'(3')-deoxyribonucleotidase